MEKESKPLPEGWYRTPKGKTLRIPVLKTKKPKLKKPSSKPQQAKKEKLYKISYISMEDFEIAESSPKRKKELIVIESAGERLIKEYLKKKSVLFIEQATFEKCVNPKTGRQLRFDFYLPNFNLCIEFDGKQHFKESKEFHGSKSKEALESQKFRDSIKTDFCKENKIKLLRIPYFKINKISSILNKNL